MIGFCLPLSNSVEPTNFSSLASRELRQSENSQLEGWIIFFFTQSQRQVQMLNSGSKEKVFGSKEAFRESLGHRPVCFWRKRIMFWDVRNWKHDSVSSDKIHTNKTEMENAKDVLAGSWIINRWLPSLTPSFGVWESRSRANDLWKALCGHVKEHCPFTGQVTQDLYLSHFPVCLNGPNANDRFDWARVTLVRFL